KEELLSNIDFLDDSTLWATEDLTDYKVIAKTIDNDFILSDDTTVLVVPAHLNKSDSEVFQMPICQFLFKFEEKSLNTDILALN
ncbi:hypothetical protein, partial [Acinetobacter baumannii]|uniref:hypothetical protein n=1 Tax=Acinetobacter baumannii TaxID=470 RepID=UPI001AECFB7B